MVDSKNNESEEYVHGTPIAKVLEEEVKDKELEASKDYTGLIPEVESPSSRVSMLFVANETVPH